MRSIACGAALALALAASPALAAETQDAFTRCLIQSSTGSDRIALMRWLFAAISVHPEARDLTNLTSARRGELSKDAAGRIMRLMFDDCADQTLAMIDDEDGARIEKKVEKGFELFGEVAMQELMNDKAVQAEFEGLQPYAETWINDWLKRKGLDQ